MIEYIKGDVTKARELVILQGCNAQGKMNSGVAKDIREKWPEVFDHYSAEYSRGGLQLGEIYPCFGYIRSNGIFKTHSFPNKIIVNGITQQYYGRDPNIVYVDYGAIRNVLKYTKIFLDKVHQTSIAMPKIGSGLGNGDWSIIENTIKEILPDYWVKIYVPD